MSRQMSSWEISVRKALLDKGWGMRELAAEIGRDVQYTSSVVCGRVKAKPTIDAISDVLNVPRVTQ